MLWLLYWLETYYPFFRYGKWVGTRNCWCRQIGSTSVGLCVSNHYSCHCSVCFLPLAHCSTPFKKQHESTYSICFKFLVENRVVEPTKRWNTISNIASLFQRTLGNAGTTRPLEFKDHLCEAERDGPWKGYTARFVSPAWRGSQRCELLGRFQKGGGWGSQYAALKPTVGTWK